MGCRNVGRLVAGVTDAAATGCSRKTLVLATATHGATRTPAVLVVGGSMTLTDNPTSSKDQARSSSAVSRLKPFSSGTVTIFSGAIDATTRLGQTRRPKISAT